MISRLNPGPCAFAPSGLVLPSSTLRDGEISGYSATGKIVKAILPSSTVPIEITISKIWRSKKMTAHYFLPHD
jgi:hypothetical protein